MLRKDVVRRIYEANGNMNETQEFTQIIVTGNLTKQPETRRYSDNNGQQQMLVVSGLANNGYGKNKTTTFFNLSFFEKNAEIMQKLDIQKGDRMLIVGRYKERPYQGSDGTQKTSNDIIVESFEILSFKNYKANSTQNPNGNNDVNNNVNNTVTEEDSQKYATYGMADEFNF